MKQELEKEKIIAKQVLLDFRTAQLNSVGIGCMCNKCIECMRKSLKKNKLIVNDT